MEIDLGNECPELLAWHRSKTYPLGEFAVQVRVFVEEFQSLHPKFRGLRFIGKSARDTALLNVDLSNLKSWIMKRACDQGVATMPYSNLDAAGRPTDLSEGVLGFRFGLANTKSWDAKISFMIYAGHSDGLDSIGFTFPRRDHPEFGGGPLPRQLMELVVRHWDVSHASYCRQGWHEKVNRLLPARNTKDLIDIGWLTYVADPSIAEALPKGTPCENLGNGVLFQLGDKLPAHDDPDAIAAGLALRHHLELQGKLQRPP